MDRRGIPSIFSSRKGTILDQLREIGRYKRAHNTAFAWNCSDTAEDTCMKGEVLSKNKKHGRREVVLPLMRHISTSTFYVVVLFLEHLFRAVVPSFSRRVRTACSTSRSRRVRHSHSSRNNHGPCSTRHFYRLIRHLPRHKDQTLRVFPEVSSSGSTRS